MVAPATSRGEIARNAGTLVTRDKIEYEVFQAEDKIIVRFVNRTGQTIRTTENSATLDAGGRAFAVEPQELADNQSGRVVLPPAYAADRSRSAAVATEVEVGGVDEGGLIGTRRDAQQNEAAGGSSGAAAAPPTGFRWPPNGIARLRLVFRVDDSTNEISHEWSIRRTD